MFMDPLGQDFREPEQEMISLIHDDWDLSWDDSKARGVLMAKG